MAGFALEEGLLLGFVSWIARKKFHSRLLKIPEHGRLHLHFRRRSDELRVGIEELETARGIVK